MLICGFGWGSNFKGESAEFFSSGKSIRIGRKHEEDWEKHCLVSMQYLDGVVLDEDSLYRREI